MNEIFGPCTSGKTQIPLIGDKAPMFKANTTQGYINFPEDYTGKWVILFSHPGDFTPVCTTEFIALQSKINEFKSLNTELLALSVDSVSSHMGWLHAIKKEVKLKDDNDLEISFPVIADTDMQIACKYGMIHQNTSETSTVRGVFIIDPFGIIRAILYYPMSVGRNISEIKRLLMGLQTSDKFHVVTPANWLPGEDVLLPLPKTIAGLKTRLGTHDVNVYTNTWFLVFKKLNLYTIFNSFRQNNLKCITKNNKK